jgi:hypothetical protein
MTDGGLGETRWCESARWNSASGSDSPSSWSTGNARSVAHCVPTMSLQCRRSVVQSVRWGKRRQPSHWPGDGAVEIVR